MENAPRTKTNKAQRAKTKTKRVCETQRAAQLQRTSGGIDYHQEPGHGKPDWKGPAATVAGPGLLTTTPFGGAYKDRGC